MTDNRTIRTELLSKRWNLDPFKKTSMDHNIFKKVLASIKLRNPKKYIACYWPIENEVDTIAIISNLLKLGYKVCLPSISRNKMHFKPITTIHFDYEYWKSMREPSIRTVIHIKDISLMIVPTIAFNKSNYRLGYGLNFYNNYLEDEHSIYTIGLAYDFQSNNEFTTTKQDKSLDVIITN